MTEPRNQLSAATEQDYLEDNIGTVAFHLGRDGARLTVADDSGPILLVDPGEVLKEVSRRLSTPAQSVGMPVAYRWRIRGDNRWTLLDHYPEGAMNDRSECEPLYASQPSPAATVETLTSALQHLTDLGERALLYANSRPAATVESMRAAIQRGCDAVNQELAHKRCSADTTEARGNYEDRHPTDDILWSASDHKDFIEVVEVLGIQESFQTPAEAVRELHAEIERLRAQPQAATVRPKCLCCEEVDVVADGDECEYCRITYSVTRPQLSTGEA